MILKSLSIIATLGVNLSKPSILHVSLGLSSLIVLAVVSIQFILLLNIAVLLSYSVQLTIWALGVLPIFVALTIFISPILRDQLRRKAEATAKVNSHLVESLSGMETIKAQNMELTSEWKWENYPRT